MPHSTMNGNVSSELTETLPPHTEDSVTIKVILLNGVPYIWSASEYMTLRNKHRILGILDGASNKPVKGSHHHANAQTLPVRLSEIEAHFVVKHGIAKAYLLPSLSEVAPRVSNVEVQELKDNRRCEELHQHRNKRKCQIESMVDKIIEGKRRKGRGLIPDRDTVIQEEMMKVELPYETTEVDLDDPWLKDCSYVPCDIPQPNWSLLEQLRFKVFEDFHLRRNYYVTSGLKFGGDFLVYPGDPMNYHSEYLIICHVKTRCKTPPFLKKQKRLASIVRKVLLVAFLSDDNETVKYSVVNSVKRNCPNDKIIHDL